MAQGMSTRSSSGQMIANIALTKREVCVKTSRAAQEPDKNAERFRMRAFAFGLSAHLATLAALPRLEAARSLSEVVGMLVALARSADDREEGRPMIVLRVVAAGNGCLVRLAAEGTAGQLTELFQPTLFGNLDFEGLGGAIPSHLLDARCSPGARLTGAELWVAAPAPQRPHDRP